MRMIWLLITGCFLFSLSSQAQRSYKSSSVLAGGGWYKLAVAGPGIYRVDLSILRSLGANTSAISSSSIHLYGNGGQLLPEPCGGDRTDDLVEDAILVEDGGDGKFDGSDYFLFYAQGPHHWQKDSVNSRFTHIKNVYTEAAYYFLNISGTGDGHRVKVLADGRRPNVQVTGYDMHIFHELDTVNFLSSGKNWYGEEFSTIPGGAASRLFAVTLPHPDSTRDLLLNTSCVARSVGASSNFAVTINGTTVMSLDMPAVTDGNYDVFGKAVTRAAGFRTGGEKVSLGYAFTPGAYNAQGWLDWWEIGGRGVLSMAGYDQLQFRDWNSVGGGNIGSFGLKGAGAATRVWDVSDPSNPVEMQGDLSGNVFSFTADCGSLHEYIAFNGTAKALEGDPGGADLGATGLFQPRAIGSVPNQNLHRASTVPGMLIVSDPLLLAQANRLAQLHLQTDKLQCLVVSTSEVYNEFAGGNPDPAAVRDYVKMWYDRSAGDSTKRPRYLLMFGAGSYDYKDRLTGNTNGAPAYESGSSLDPLNTYTSDDFYALLDDADDVNNLSNPGSLDIGVGRIPARTVAEATAVVDKIRHYMDPKTQGPWRNEINLIADDGDQNLHFMDAETFAATIDITSPVNTVDKIYLDAYKLQSTPAGSRYPDVNQAITSQIYNGTLIWNYTGHGSNARLSNSDILDQDIINRFNNPDKLPLFVTATCDFTPYDNPVVRSIGADLLVRANTGAIGLMTTTRLVFAFSNKVLNDNYLRMALQPRPDGSYYSLGDAVRLVKNLTYRTQTDAVNNRKFALVGDPALTLAFPRYRVTTTSVNGRQTSGAGADTLKALNTYTITGAVTDNSGAILTGFNGTVYATIFDKPRTVTTLGNSAGSQKAEFQVQDNALYKGKVPVSKGLFTYSFVVPKDINYKYGAGRISYYAGDPSGAGLVSTGAGADGNGDYRGIVVGGSGGGSSYTGTPVIQAYLNDEKFVDGGITNQQPVLLLHLQDSLGINITGTGIGHDMTAILDNNTQDPMVLNNFYEADLNTYKKGTVRYPLPVLTEGEHSLAIKVWNVANISSQTILTFRVVSGQRLILTHVLNYPNPFTTHTNFWFDHNRPGEDLSVLVQILTVSGKLVKSIRRTINTAGNRSSEIDWDGRDDYGAKIGRGVYIYLLRVRATDGSTVDKIEKLYIL